MSISVPGQVPILYLTHDQIRTLASVACNEVFSALSGKEPRSARQVADEIDRSPASVSEQIAKLLDSGLVIPAGTRKRRSRTEALYVHAGLVTRMNLQGQSAEVLADYHRRFSGQMREAERQHEAFQAAFLQDPTFQDFIVYKTYTAYLDRASALRLQLAVTEVLDLIKSMDETDPEVRAKGEYVRVRLTNILLPSTQESKRRTREEEK